MIGESGVFLLDWQARCLPYEAAWPEMQQKETKATKRVDSFVPFVAFCSDCLFRVDRESAVRQSAPPGERVHLVVCVFRCRGAGCWLVLGRQDVCPTKRGAVA
jgi:hypothetical protein